MPADAVVVVPPLLKHVAGPLLGPAMLAGAAAAHGHRTQVLDLARAWLETVDPGILAQPGSVFVGDHDRPTDRLRAAQRTFVAQTEPLFPPARSDLGEPVCLTAAASHTAIFEAAEALRRGRWGAWIRRHLERHARPDVLGISVLYSGQVLWGIATVLEARRVWPGVTVIWGGPHMTALQYSIAADQTFGRVSDGFVIGYAEATWVALLDAVGQGGAWPAEVVRAGSGSVLRAQPDGSMAPAFDDAERWPARTLPAQATRGCVYGRCTYCTYPAIEGGFARLPESAWLPVIDHAAATGARVSFKDSLLAPRRLEAIAARIDGRVRWSACTKLHPRLDGGLLPALARGGLATLEIGLETLSPSGQLLIDKRQTPALFTRFLDAAELAGVSVVINTMTGLPGVGADEAEHWQDFARTELARRPGLHSKLEHNGFQLERLSPMAGHPSRFGIEVVGAWPWASILAFRTLERAA